jgi:transposase InsO family protein
MAERPCTWRIVSAASGGCESTLRFSSMRSTTASRRAIYSAVRQLPEWAERNRSLASARAILPTCTSNEETRYGYRRLHAAPERRGQAVNLKRVNRLYAEEGPVVRRRRRKRLMRVPDRAAARECRPGNSGYQRLRKREQVKEVRSLLLGTADWTVSTLT